MANVDFSLSYGMFEDNVLVGFILNAVDHRNNKRIAYNTGTGVLPEYRGQHIVDSLYEFAIPNLRKHGIEKCTLEVIKENAVAINAYKRIGFKKTKSYRCYSGVIDCMHVKTLDFVLKKVATSFFDWNSMKQGLYSWDNQIETIKRGSYKTYAVLYRDEIVAYFIINQESGYLAQFDTFKNTEDNWNRLFIAIRSISKTIKINNVDASLTDKIHYLTLFGLRNTVDQYEMEMEL
jgi:RimJ/RimL family protein N-acetyltransferase